MDFLLACHSGSFDELYYHLKFAYDYHGIAMQYSKKENYFHLKFFESYAKLCKIH